MIKRLFAGAISVFVIASIFLFNPAVDQASATRYCRERDITRSTGSYGQINRVGKKFVGNYMHVYVNDPNRRSDNANITSPFFQTPRYNDALDSCAYGIKITNLVFECPSYVRQRDKKAFFRVKFYPTNRPSDVNSWKEIASGKERIIATAVKSGTEFQVEYAYPKSCSVRFKVNY